MTNVIGKKNKKGQYVSNSNWQNFHNWKTIGSKYTVQYKELEMEQEDNNFIMAAE